MIPVEPHEGSTVLFCMVLYCTVLKSTGAMTGSSISPRPRPDGFLSSGVRVQVGGWGGTGILVLSVSCLSWTVDVYSSPV